MKISTLRTLVILLDVALFLGMGGLVYQIREDKQARGQEAATERQFLRMELEEVIQTAGRNERDNRRRIEDRHTDVDLANLPEPEVVDPGPEEETEPTQPVDAKLPPLDTQIRLVAISAATGDALPFVLYTRLDGTEGAGATAPAGGGDARTGGRRAAPIRRPGMPAAAAGALGPGVPVDAVSVGHWIELGDPVEALVKEIHPEKVVFLYDDELVEMGLPVPEPDSGAGAGGAAGAGGSEAMAQATVSDDPAQWIIFDDSDPQDVRITPTGVKSIEAKKDQALEGVTWGSERVTPPGMSSQRAIKITKVPQGSALARAGLSSGDVILSINGQSVSSRGDIVSYVEANPNLTRYTVKIMRRGGIRTRTVTVPRR